MNWTTLIDQLSRGTSRNALSQRLGFSRNYLREVCRGAIRPTPEAAKVILNEAERKGLLASKDKEKALWELYPDPTSTPVHQPL